MENIELNVRLLNDIKELEAMFDKAFAEVESAARRDSSRQAA